MTTLVLMFKKIESKDETIYENFYSSWKAETIINENDIDDVFKSIHTTIITNIQKSLGKGSGLIIDSVIGHTISIWKNDPLAGNSYIKLPVELDHPRKGLINIQNVDDNECFKWCSVKYLNSADHNPRRITKHDKEFAKRLDFKDIKLPVKIRDIPKPKKKKSISISVFDDENKEKQPMYQKMLGRKTCWFIIDSRRRNTFMYDHSLHFCRYYFMLSLKKKSQIVILKIALKLMINKEL